MNLIQIFLRTEVLTGMAEQWKTEAVPFLLFMQSYIGAQALICINFLVPGMNIHPYGTENEQKFIPTKYVRIFLSVHGTHQWDLGDGPKSNYQTYS